MIHFSSHFNTIITKFTNSNWIVSEFRFYIV